MAPEQAESATLRYALRGVDISNRVWRSDVLTKGTVIALDPTAFVSGFGSGAGAAAPLACALFTTPLKNRTNVCLKNASVRFM
jgi:hypothetical protein